MAALPYSAANAQEIGTIGQEVVAGLNSLGYERVNVQGCEISYLRRTEPNTQNNGYFAIRRYLDLESLHELTDVTVYSIENAGVTSFLMDLEFDDGYDERYFPLFKFNSWVREEYPDSGWPYKGTGSHDDFAAILEFELYRQVEGVNTLNRMVFFSKYGPVPFVQQRIATIASRDSESLERLLDSIRKYSIENNCDVEN